MIYTQEVEKMCTVAQGVHHGCAPIPEEAKWIQAKEIKDIFRSKVRVAPSISFESPEYINKLLYPEMSRKPVKFYDLR